MSTLWLARHAQPLVPPGQCYGASDIAADAQATQQAARALAAALPRRLAAVACSPRRRCRQLAEALQACRPQLAWAVDARLAEMDFGRWEGRSWDAIARDELEAWNADFASYRCGGGESVEQLLARVDAALEAARALPGDVLWITHAGVIRAAHLLAAGVPRPLLSAHWPARAPAFGAWQGLSLHGADGRSG